MFLTSTHDLKIVIGKLDNYNKKELLKELKEDGRYDFGRKQLKKRTSNRKVQA